MNALFGADHSAVTTNALRSYGLCIRYYPLQRGDSLTKGESGICQGLVALLALCQSVRCPVLGRLPSKHLSRKSPVTSLLVLWL